MTPVALHHFALALCLLEVCANLDGEATSMASIYETETYDNDTFTRLNPRMENQRHTLTLGIIWYYLPYDQMMTTSFTMGIEKAKQMLPNFDIEYHFTNTDCNALKGMKAVVQLQSAVKQLDGIIGAACSVVCEPVGLLTAAWNIPQISHYCASMSLSNKKTFATFTRVIGTYNGYTSAIMALLETFKWTRFSIITDIIPLFKLAAEQVKREAEGRGLDVHFYVVDSAIMGDDDDEIDQEKFKILQNIIRDIRQSTRVTLLLFYQKDIELILKTAYTEGLLNGDHAFFGLDPVTLDMPDYIDVDRHYQGLIAISNDDPSGAAWNTFYADLVSDIIAQNLNTTAIKKALEGNPIAAGTI